MHPCGTKKELLVFQYNIDFIKLELFSFAIPSTAKEIIFNYAAFASQAKPRVAGQAGR